MNALIILFALLAVSFEKAQAGRNDLKIFEVRQDDTNIYLKPYSAQKLLNQMNAAINSRPAPKKVDYFYEPVPIPFVGKKTHFDLKKKRQPLNVHKQQAKIMNFYDHGRRDLSSDDDLRGTALPPNDRTGGPPEDEEEGTINADDVDDNKSNTE